MSEHLLKRFDIGDFELRRSGRESRPVQRISVVNYASCEIFHLIFFFTE